MTEMWLPVPGWEGLYSISDHGRVRSEHRTIVMGNGRTRRIREKIVGGWTTANGYQAVFLCEALTRRVCVNVHRLVMEAFVGPCPAGMEVLHWDDNPTNNVLSNLRYGTRSDNLRDSVRNGRHPWASLTHCKRGHAFDGANTYVAPSGRRTCRICSRARVKKCEDAKRARKYREVA